MTMNTVTTFTDARVPTAHELRARRNALVQLWRFAILNFKMVVMITLGHH
jgi:hypothetical protein